MKKKENYQRILDTILDKIEKQGEVPKLCLHSCCAPCSSYVLEYLSQYFRITVFYYNPNLYPNEELVLRSKEQQRLIQQMPTKYPVEFKQVEQLPEEFYQAVKGYEQESEGGKRCEKCFRLRLEKTVQMAKEIKADYFTTTLSISPLKNAQVLNEIGKELEQLYGVSYLYSDFKKKGGYLRSTELAKEYDLYRQDYCGCVYSYQEREKRKEEN